MEQVLERKIKKSKLSRNARAWMAVVGSVLCLMSATGVFYGTGALVIAPMAEKLGVTVAQVGLYTSFWTVGIIVASFASVWIMSKLNLHYTAVLGAVLGGLGILTMGLAPALPVVYFGAFMVGCGTIWCGPAIVQIAISKWFYTGRATLLGVAGMSESVGTTVMSLAMAAAMTASSTGDYTSSMIVGAIIIMVCGVFSGLVLLRGTPEDYGFVPVGAEKLEGNEAAGGEKEKPGEVKEVPGIPAKKAVRSYPFWTFMIAAVALNMGYYLMFSQNAAYNLNMLGLTAIQVAALVSTASWAKGLSKIFYGILGDRYGMRIALSITVLITIFGAVLMFFELGYWALVMSAIGLGVANALSGAGTLTLSRMFGPKDFMKLATLPHAANGIGVMIAPIMFAALYNGEMSGYRTIFALMVALEIVYLVLIQFALKKKNMFENKRAL